MKNTILSFTLLFLLVLPITATAQLEIKKDEKGRYGVYSQASKEFVIKPGYQEIVLREKRFGKYALLNKKGKWGIMKLYEKEPIVLPFEYDQMAYTHADHVMVKKDGKWALYDESLVDGYRKWKPQFITGFQYDTIKPFSNVDSDKKELVTYYSCKEGAYEKLLRVEYLEGKYVTTFHGPYNEISNSGLCRYNDKWGYLLGMYYETYVLNPEYDEVRPMMLVDTIKDKKVIRNHFAVGIRGNQKTLHRFPATLPRKIESMPVDNQWISGNRLYYTQGKDTMYFVQGFYLKKGQVYIDRYWFTIVQDKNQKYGLYDDDKKLLMDFAYDSIFYHTDANIFFLKNGPYYTAVTSKKEFMDSPLKITDYQLEKEAILVKTELGYWSPLYRSTMVVDTVYKYDQVIRREDAFHLLTGDAIVVMDFRGTVSKKVRLYEGEKLIYVSGDGSYRFEKNGKQGYRSPDFTLYPGFDLIEFMSSSYGGVVCLVKLNGVRYNFHQNEAKDGSRIATIDRSAKCSNPRCTNGIVGHTTQTTEGKTYTTTSSTYEVKFRGTPYERSERVIVTKTTKEPDKVTQLPIYCTDPIHDSGGKKIYLVWDGSKYVIEDAE